MKSRTLALSAVTALVAVGVGLWFGGWGDKEARPRLPQTPVQAKEISMPVVPPASPAVAAPPSAVPPTIEDTAAPSAALTMQPNSTVGAATPEKPNLDLLAAAAIQIDQVGLMFRDYRTLMGSNPVGTNSEIIQAVNGGNPKKARLGPPEGQQINGRGELMDSWGTAYFFHQKSATDMEIHSAGPDKQFGTPDDLIGR